MTKRKIGPYDYHEALDRVFIVTDMIEDYVLTNPAVKQNKEWKKKAEEAQDILSGLYQAIGVFHLSRDPVDYSGEKI